MPRIVRASVRLPVSPAAALDKFLDVGAMHRWWGIARGLVEPREGGVWAVAWDVSEHGYRYVETGIITALQADARLEIGSLLYFNPERRILGPMSLAVFVEPGRGGTSLSVEQGGLLDGPDWDGYHDGVVTGWPLALDLLRRHLEEDGGPPA